MLILSFVIGELPFSVTFPFILKALFASKVALSEFKMISFASKLTLYKSYFASLVEVLPTSIQSESDPMVKTPLVLMLNSFIGLSLFSPP